MAGVPGSSAWDSSPPLRMEACRSGAEDMSTWKELNCSTWDRPVKRAPLISSIWSHSIEFTSPMTTQQHMIMSPRAMSMVLPSTPPTVLAIMYFKRTRSTSPIMCFPTAKHMGYMLGSTLKTSSLITISSQMSGSWAQAPLSRGPPRTAVYVLMCRTTDATSLSPTISSLESWGPVSRSRYFIFITSTIYYIKILYKYLLLNRIYNF